MSQMSHRGKNMLAKNIQQVSNRAKNKIQVSWPQSKVHWITLL